MRDGLLLIATALLGCGRVGFDGAGDAGAGDASAGDASADTDSMPGCPAGYVSIPRSTTRYRFDPGPATWLAAELACEAEGTHLAIPDNIDESDSLGLTFLAGVQKMFIGVSDRVVEGTFVPVTGGALGFTRFAAGEPNGGANADGISLRGVNGVWEDEADALAIEFICECDGKAADPTTF